SRNPIEILRQLLLRAEATKQFSIRTKPFYRTTQCCRNASLLMKSQPSAFKRDRVRAGCHAIQSDFAGDGGREAACSKLRSYGRRTRPFDCRRRQAGHADAVRAAQRARVSVPAALRE